MLKMIAGKTVLCFTVALVAATALFSARKTGGERISAFGQYKGYSEARYDGSERRSEYLTLANGTRLAYDLLLPTKDGVPADEPLPVLFKYTPYLRSFTIFDADGSFLIEDLYELKWYEKAMLRIRRLLYERGDLMDPLFRTKWLGGMLQHGYAVIVVERPGTGASFGVMDPSFEVGAREADEILDWIAAQDWCDGTIGMYGDSWQAMIQFAAASTGNPHLKAIFPVSSALDNYQAVTYPGGVYNKAFGSFFSWSNTALQALAVPVDGDSDGALLAQARAERSHATVGVKSAELFREHPFHDSAGPDGVKIWEGELALYPLLDRINEMGIPIYMANGWYDLFAKDMFLWYRNLTVPKRLMVRPLDHSQMEGEGQADLDFEAEVHRWFDYWLKGIDNGIMNEPPINYYVMGVSKKKAWRTSHLWPPRDQVLAQFYFSGREGGSAAATTEGFLQTEPPVQLETADVYTLDYSTTTGNRSRWSAVLYARDYPDMRHNDEKALTYTSPPLERDVEIVGHPVVQLWVATEFADLDLFVYLEAVDSRGRSTYVTEGNLRASHRATGEPPYDNLGLPYHSHREDDLLPIPPGEPIELTFDLVPTAYVFPKGSRIRVAITGADADNYETPVLDPAPEIRLLRNPGHLSMIELPVEQGDDSTPLWEMP